LQKHAFVGICIAALFVASVSANLVVSQSFSAPNESGDTVHANPYLSTSQTGSSSSGNTVLFQIYALGFNPLKDGDPNFDYYLFDIQAAATAASGWSVDGSGKDDSHGPSLLVTATIQGCTSGGFVQAHIDPGTTDKFVSANSPTQVQVGLSLGLASVSISDSFTPGSSETQAEGVGQCLVQWNSGYCNQVGSYCLPLTQPNVAAYSYHFAAVIQAPENQRPTLGITVQASFWSCSYVVYCNNFEKATTQLVQSYAMPPVTTVTSNPTGSGYVVVSGKPVITPAQFVWNVGDSVQLYASQFVPSGTGIQYVFLNWSDGGAISHNILAPSTTTTYQANYQKQDRLIISEQNPSQGTTNPPPGSYWYNDGQAVTIVSMPSPGYQLDNWVLDGANAGNKTQFSFSMSSPHNLTAIYELEPVLSLSVQTGGSVTITSPAINGGTPVIVAGGTSQSFPVPTGTTVTVTATATTSYQFVNWTGLSTQTSNTLSLRIVANIPLTANFVLLSPAAQTTSISTSSAESRPLNSVTGNANQNQAGATTITDPIVLIPLALLIVIVGIGVGFWIARKSARQKIQSLQRL